MTHRPFEPDPQRFPHAAYTVDGGPPILFTVRGWELADGLRTGYIVIRRQAPGAWGDSEMAIKPTELNPLGFEDAYERLCAEPLLPAYDDTYRTCPGCDLLVHHSRSLVHAQECVALYSTL